MCLCVGGDRVDGSPGGCVTVLGCPGGCVPVSGVVGRMSHCFGGGRVDVSLCLGWPIMARCPFNENRTFKRGKVLRN